MLGEGCLQKARGVQENLWPKFILKNAPLRATSSAGDRASAMPWSKVMKLKKPRESCPVVIAGWLESFTFAGGWKTLGWGGGSIECYGVERRNADSLDASYQQVRNDSRPLRRGISGNASALRRFPLY